MLPRDQNAATKRSIEFLRRKHVLSNRVEFNFRAASRVQAGRDPPPLGHHKRVDGISPRVIFCWRVGAVSSGMAAYQCAIWAGGNSTLWQ
jgi:hypothetical protein